MMLPGKVGAVRKLTSMIGRLRQNGHIREDNTHEELVIDAVPTLVPASDEVHSKTPSNCDNQDMATDKDKNSTLCLQRTAPPTEASSPGPSRIQGRAKYAPTYSTVIQGLLDSGDIINEWDKFIEETAYHVLAVGDFDNKSLYDDFGRLMYAKFPCIAFLGGAHAWSHFNKVLSQKVRNVRWRRNIRSQKSTEGPSQKKQKTHLNLACLDGSQEMDLASARKLLTDEIKKPKGDQDKPLILKAQRATYKERRQFIETLQAGGSISDIIGAYPILGISCYVEKEFFLLKPDLSSKNQMLERWTDLLGVLDKTMGRPEGTDEDEEDSSDSNENILDVLQRVEEKIKYISKKGKKELPSLISKVDVKDASLTSARREAPRLVVICDSKGNVGSAYIVGDIVNLPTSCNVKEALLSLMFAYYVWDLSYPKQFQLLGLLQTHLLEDRAHFHKGSNYMRFQKLMDKYL